MNEQIVRKVKREMKKRLADLCNNERLIGIGKCSSNSLDKIEMCVRPEVQDVIVGVINLYTDEILSLGGNEFNDIWYYFMSKEMINSETKKIAEKLYVPIPNS